MAKNVKKRQAADVGFPVYQFKVTLQRPSVFNSSPWQEMLLHEVFSPCSSNVDVTQRETVQWSGIEDCRGGAVS